MTVVTLLTLLTVVTVVTKNGLIEKKRKLWTKLSDNKIICDEKNSDEKNTYDKKNCDEQQKCKNLIKKKEKIMEEKTNCHGIFFCDEKKNCADNLCDEGEEKKYEKKNILPWHKVVIKIFSNTNSFCDNFIVRTTFCKYTFCGKEEKNCEKYFFSTQI